MFTAMLFGAAWQHYLFAMLLSVTGLFVILLVLVQRGRGGGLAGAFGGMGGQSAFGTKAGDLFTRITMITAGFWILLCIAAVALLNPRPTPTGPAPAGAELNVPGGEVTIPGADVRTPGHEDGMLLPADDVDGDLGGDLGGGDAGAEGQR